MTTSGLVRIRVHNRGYRPIRKDNVMVYLLMTDVTAGAIPPLPAGFREHINKGGRDWLTGTRWMFADPLQQFAHLAGNLDEYSSEDHIISPDFSQFSSSPLGVHNVCFAAIITTVDKTSQLSGAATDLDQLVVSDNHVTYRKISIS